MIERDYQKLSGLGKRKSKKKKRSKENKSERQKVLYEGQEDEKVSGVGV